MSAWANRHRRRASHRSRPAAVEMTDAGHGEFDPQAQPAPDYELDQRIAW